VKVVVHGGADLKKIIFLASAVVGMSIGVYAQGIHWAHSFESASQQASQSHKLLLVDFYTSWCQWCKVMDKEVYPNAQVIKASNDFVPVRLDAEKNGVSQAQDYSVRAYPTILFLTPEGRPVYRLEGYLPAHDFLGLMHEVEILRQRMEKGDATLRSNPQDLNTLATMTNISVEAGDMIHAEGYWKRARQVIGRAKSDAVSMAGDNIGNSYIQHEHYDLARAVFKTSLSAAKTPDAVANAMVGLAISYLADNQVPKGKQIVNAALTIPNLSADETRRLRALLAQVNSQ